MALPAGTLGGGVFGKEEEEVHSLLPSVPGQSEQDESASVPEGVDVIVEAD